MVEKQTKRGRGRALLHLYWEETRKYPFLLTGVILGVLIIQVSLLSAPLFLRQFFNTLVTNAPTPEVSHHLYVLLALVAAMYLLEQVGLRIRDFSNGHMQSQVMPNLMERAFSYLLDHSYNFFISNFAGSLTSKVSRFGKAYEGMFDTIFVSFLPTTLFVLGTISILFTRNHILGASLAVWSVAFVSFQIWISRMRQPLRVKRAAADTKITATLADAISNQNTIALFSGGAYERGLFKGVVQTWGALTQRYWDIDNLIWMGIGLFMLSIEMGLLGGAVYFWGRGLLTIGDFVMIQAYLFVTFDRLVSINRELRGFYTNVADAGEMVEIFETPHAVQDSKNAPELVVSKGAIHFEDVTFHFKEDSALLQKFNLQIQPHEKIALVGPSGAGKSTITKLLLRFYDITSGVIAIDGQNIAKITQNSLRSAISFVPQEPVLFHRTLKENIRYGRHSATDEEVIAAAKKAHCHEFISELTDGYDTFVGERGVKLSGGERQRVAIARAILKDSPILVLDEATSSLDSESEALIQDALENLMREKTVIVIAHRLSTILKMDRIVVIEEGNVAASGTHEELLSKGGLYQKLWNIQAGGFIGEDTDKSVEKEVLVSEDMSEIEEVA